MDEEEKRDVQLLVIREDGKWELNPELYRDGKLLYFLYFLQCNNSCIAVDDRIAWVEEEEPTKKEIIFSLRVEAVDNFDSITLNIEKYKKDVFFARVIWDYDQESLFEGEEWYVPKKDGLLIWDVKEFLEKLTVRLGGRTRRGKMALLEEMLEKCSLDMSENVLSVVREFICTKKKYN